ncbi:MAG: amino acid ABC transporter substrate-binding protein [Desulfobacterales bacterium]|nr:amino acid ABC transporter substrate-binding protein [Desulfobacterales bacterium]
MQQLKKWFSSLLVFIVVLVLVGNTKADIKKILLSEEAEWPPYTYEKSGTPSKGLSLALMTEIFSRLKIDMDFKLFPQNRCIEQMREGTRDAMTLISKNKEREKFLEFSEPLVESRGLIYYSSTRKTPFIWDSLSDLKGHRIGIVLGYNYGDDFIKSREKYALKVSEVTTLEQNFEKLIVGRIDIMLANQAEASEFIRRNLEYHEKLKAADKPYLSYFYHIGFSKKSSARVLLPKINEIIQQMKAEGILDKIIAEYLL